MEYVSLSAAIHVFKDTFARKRRKKKNEYVSEDEENDNDVGEEAVVDEIHGEDVFQIHAGKMKLLPNTQICGENANDDDDKRIDGKDRAVLAFHQFGESIFRNQISKMSSEWCTKQRVPSNPSTPPLPPLFPENI